MDRMCLIRGLPDAGESITLIKRIAAEPFKIRENIPGA
jgi:hypothetical protein